MQYNLTEPKHKLKLFKHLKKETDLVNLQITELSVIAKEFFFKLD